MALIKQLSIDGVIGDIYDADAVHESDLVSTVLSVLEAPEIRTALLNIYHPIGSYYFTDRNVNPGTFLGGTWSNVEGKFLIGASSDYPVNSTGGSPDTIVVSHTHTMSASSESAGAHTHSLSGSTASAGAHTHDMGGKIWSDGSGNDGSAYVMSNKREQKKRSTGSAGAHTHNISGTATSAGAHSHSITVTAQSSGSDGTGKNLPPYKAAYIWVRTA